MCAENDKNFTPLLKFQGAKDDTPYVNPNVVRLLLFWLDLTVRFFLQYVFYIAIKTNVQCRYTNITISLHVSGCST